VCQTSHVNQDSNEEKSSLIQEIICQNPNNFTIIQNGNDQNHERREVELPDQCDEHEAKLQSEQERIQTY